MQKYIIIQVLFSIANPKRSKKNYFFLVLRDNHPKIIRLRLGNTMRTATKRGKSKKQTNKQNKINKQKIKWQQIINIAKIIEIVWKKKREVYIYI